MLTSIAVALALTVAISMGLRGLVDYRLSSGAVLVLYLALYGAAMYLRGRRQRRNDPPPADEPDCRYQDRSPASVHRASSPCSP